MKKHIPIEGPKKTTVKPYDVPAATQWVGFAPYVGSPGPLAPVASFLEAKAPRTPIPKTIKRSRDLTVGRRGDTHEQSMVQKTPILALALCKFFQYLFPHGLKIGAARELELKILPKDSSGLCP